MLSVPVDDRGFTLAHGLFETILWAGGELVWWDDHFARLARGCAALRLPPPDRSDCLAAVRTALAAAGDPDRAAVRLNWTAGSGGRGVDLPQPVHPRLTASAALAPRAITPISLAVASTRRNAHSPASRLKSLAYLDNVLARAEAREAGADEALMLNTSDEVACAAVGNLFWLTGDELHTPSLECGVLDGVARGRVLQIAAAQGLRVREVRAPLSSVEGKPAFLTNSLVGVRAISRLGARECPRSDVIARLAEALNLP